MAMQIQDLKICWSCYFIPVVRTMLGGNISATDVTFQVRKNVLRIKDADAKIACEVLDTID